MNFLPQVEAPEFDVYRPGRPKSLDTCAKQSLPILHEALKDDVVVGELDWSLDRGMGGSRDWIGNPSVKMVGRMDWELGGWRT
jgi:hypothetical protein